MGQEPLLEPSSHYTHHTHVRSTAPAALHLVGPAEQLAQ